MQQELAERLSVMEQDVNVNEKWTAFKKIVLESAKKIIGHLKRKSEDWFENNRAEIDEILKAKWRKHQELLANETPRRLESFKKAKEEAQRKTRALKNRWWVEKSRELERMAANNDSKGFYNGLKTIFGPRTSSMAPLKNKEGTETITDNEKIIER